MNTKFASPARIVFPDNKTNSKTKTNVKTSEVTPFCKVCYDAKKENYNTHYVRETINGKSIITCPYLLTLECGYCHDMGHTVKYCPVLNGRKQNQVQRGNELTTDGWNVRSRPGKFHILGLEEEDMQKEKRKQNQDKKAVNLYLALEDEAVKMEIEAEAEAQAEREYPVLGVPIAVAVAAPKSWASVVSGSGLSEAQWNDWSL